MPSCRGAAEGLPRGLTPLPRAPLGGRSGTGEILVCRPGMEVPGDFLRCVCGGVLRCQVPHDGKHRPCGEGPSPGGGGVYTWMVHCGGAPHAGCVDHPSNHVHRQNQDNSRGLYDNPLRRSAVAAPGVQGHFRLARMGDSVDHLLDVHAAARGLIQNPALRHPVAQGGACDHVPHCRQRSVIRAGLGVLFGAPPFSGAVVPPPRRAEGGHAARRRRRFRGRAARGGLQVYLQVGFRARFFLWGVSLAASESQRPDDLVCRVQRQRSGACFAWGRGFRHCCVAVRKSGGWGADFPWLVYVLCARRGVEW